MVLVMSDMRPPIVSCEKHSYKVNLGVRVERSRGSGNKNYVRVSEGPLDSYAGDCETNILHYFRRNMVISSPPDREG